MSVADLFLETLSAFNANRARSLLTILGIVIGIAAVISMTAIIGGIKGALVGEMGLTQARLVMISCTYGSGLLKSDVEDMARDLNDSFEAISPLVFSTSDISSTKEKARGLVYGTGPEHASIMGMNFVQGGYFTKTDADSASLVAVIEEMGVKKLFGSTTAQAVGQTVRIGGSEYEIIGVLESTSAEESDNVKVYMPFNTCAQRVAGSANVSEVYALASEEADAEAAANAAREWLIKRFRIPESEQENSLYIITMQSIIDQLNTMMASFQLLMTVVASISLVVGGIGIMNMMLTNVTERIREIAAESARRTSPRHHAAVPARVCLPDACRRSFRNRFRPFARVRLGWYCRRRPQLGGGRDLDTLHRARHGLVRRGDLRDDRHRVRLLPRSPSRQARSCGVSALPVETDCPIPSRLHGAVYASPLVASSTVLPSST